MPDDKIPNSEDFDFKKPKKDVADLGGLVTEIEKDIKRVGMGIKEMTAGQKQFNTYALFMTTNPAVKLLSYLTYFYILLQLF